MSREGGGDWLCGSCQHVNFKKRDTCQRCRFPKNGDSTVMPSTAVLAGDWYCSSINCGAHNFASRPTCFRCGALKAGYATVPPGWKAGDWLCTRCAEHNYASRMECHRCKTQRGFGGPV